MGTNKGPPTKSRKQATFGKPSSGRDASCSGDACNSRDATINNTLAVTTASVGAPTIAGMPVPGDEM
jgi:hypothetical protein